METATEEGLISQAGAFYTVGGQKYQGKARLVAALRENASLRGELEHALRTQLGFS